MSLFRFVDAEKARFPVSLLCKTVGVAKSGYYAWKNRPPSKRTHEDAAFTERIVEVHERSRDTYGYPRVHAELRAIGVRCGRRRVAQLMRKAGIRGCMRGKKRRTTRRDPRVAPVPDLVRRNFRAGAPDRLWTAEITYAKTDEGFPYLAFVLANEAALLTRIRQPGRLRGPHGEGGSGGVAKKRPPNRCKSRERGKSRQL